MAWLSCFRSRNSKRRLSLAHTRRKPQTQLHLSVRPALEALEDRLVPSAAGWAINAGSASNWGMAVDGSHNSVLTGYFTGTSTFGNTTTGTTTLTSAGGMDASVAKYDPNGVLLWAERFGGTGDDNATRVATDAAGNIYVAGYFSGTAAFGPSATPITLTSAGGMDAFLAKLDPSGNVQWVSQLGGTSDDQTWSVAVDGSGNVYTTGRFNGSASFSLNGAAAGVTLTPTGGQGQDAFVAKLDAGGNVAWARNMGSTGTSDWGIGVAADPNGYVYATGRYTGTASFGSTLSLTSSSSSGTNGYVTRLDPSGNFLWAQSVGGAGASGNQGGYGIAVDGTGGVYVTGDMDGTSCQFGSTTFTAVSDDSFVTRMDAATGSFLWADQLGGAGQDMGMAIALDGSGNVYTTGTYGANNQTGNFDPHGSFILSPGKAGLAAGNYREAYVSMLDPNGSFLGAWQTRASATDHNGGEGIAADSAGDVWISGGFDVTTTFTTGQTLSASGTNVGSTFLMQMNAPHGAILGTVWDDLNNNGVRDTNSNGTPAEPPLAGWTVYADLNNNGVLDSGDPTAVTDASGNYAIDSLAPGTYTVRTQPPAGWSGWTTTSPAGAAAAVTVGTGFSRNNNFGEYKPTVQTTYTNSSATSISATSPRNPTTTTSSTISVSDTSTLLDLSVKVNISYPTDSSLTLTLVAPDGTQIQLAAANGGSGANFTNTTFSDEAATSISSGTAPFSGTYRPLWMLDQLEGKSVQGKWTLQIVNGSKSSGKLNSWSLTTTHATTTSPQLSANGVAPGGEKVAPALTSAQLAPIAREAVDRWASTGLTSQQLALLHQVHFSIQDLKGSGELGQTVIGSTQVMLDATADGWGWFVDPTPRNDSEFAVVSGAYQRQALPGSPAYGHMDLLTVVEHELGHVLGLNDLNAGQAGNELMSATLATGTRRLPEPVPFHHSGGGLSLTALDALFTGLTADQLDGAHRRS